MSDRDELRAFVLSNFLPDEAPETLADTTLLVTTGIVSSLGVIELVTFLDEKLGVRVEQEDLDPERLDSIEMILGLVKRTREKS